MILVQVRLHSRNALTFCCTLLLEEVLVLQDQVFVAKIGRDSLSDACRLDIKNGSSSCACLPASFLGYESDRVRFELQTVLPFRCVEQLGIGKEASVQKDLVVVTDERSSVAHLEFPRLE